jgi:hypothetical protein
MSLPRALAHRDDAERREDKWDMRNIYNARGDDKRERRILVKVMR